uniref:AAA+ ATPase domain-containing protein n=1 Tax=Pinguiococcus pyrenoidosus TaxID=172671 RepID=A0A7R9YFF6_9STRA
MTMKQEETKQVHMKENMRKYELQQEQMAIERVQREAEESRRTIQATTEEQKKREDYRDQLERRRQVEVLQAQRDLAEQERAKQEEALKRQEAIRRKTLEYEAELRQQTEMARVKAETEGRIEQERKNFDLRIKELQTSAKEYRETTLESIKLAGQTIGSGISEFLNDREKMTAAVGTTVAIAFGIYAARWTTGITGRFIESRLGKPSLVRETSRINFLNPVKALREALVVGANRKSAMEGIVLQQETSKRLDRIAQTTRNTKANGAPFRHLLLHGPPGTGKTMYARQLASHSGMDYAIMTGGDIGPLGKDAVTELHRLFDWSQSSRRGLLLFVDEADAFLRRRRTEQFSEDARNALNAFLYRTGTESDKFMMVVATNQPQALDDAVTDRVDEIVEVGLPGVGERLSMLNQYMEEYLLNPPKRTGLFSGTATEIKVTGITDGHLAQVAKDTEGFSGREIAKLVIAWQAAAYGTENAELNVELMKQVLKEQKESRRIKAVWESSAGSAQDDSSVGKASA